MEPMQGICRVCLREEDIGVKLVGWHLPLEGVNENLSYVECFQQCTQLNSLLDSRNIDTMKIYEYFCLSCALKLKEAYLFIRKAKEADTTLRLNYWKLATDSDRKLFEWVGVDKESMQFNIKKTNSDEEPLSIGCNDNLEENSYSLEHGQSINEESEGVSEVEIKVVSKINEINSHTFQLKAKRKIKPYTRKNKNEEVVCSFCKKSMTKKQLLRHSCNRSSKSFLCKSCPRTFRHRSTLVQHEQIHENNRERKYDCTICGRKFYTKMARGNHLKTHDPSRKPCFHCDECDQSFLFKGNLLVHKQKHAGQTIQCKYCQKKYVRPVDLEVHLRSHTGDTPFKCDKCVKAFTKRSSLQKHLHLHDGVQWKCDDCGKEYLYEWTLQRHRLEHTGMPLQCSICSKGFPEMYKIRRHIKGVHKINLPDIEKFVVRLKDKIKCDIISESCSKIVVKDDMNK